jgi:hypothetical protein
MTNSGAGVHVRALFKQEADVEEDGLTDEQYNIVQEREEAYKRGEGKGYTWEEAKALTLARASALVPLNSSSKTAFPPLIR